MYCQHAAYNHAFIQHNLKQHHSWVVDSDEEDLPPDIHIPHTQTYLADSGTQSKPAHTIYVAGPPSLQRQGPSSSSQQDFVEHSYYHEGYIDHLTHLEQANLDEMEIDIADDESNDNLDPTYQQHLDNQEPGPPKVQMQATGELNSVLSIE